VSEVASPLTGQNHHTLTMHPPPLSVWDAELSQFYLATEAPPRPQGIQVNENSRFSFLFYTSQSLDMHLSLYVPLSGEGVRVESISSVEAGTGGKVASITVGSSVGVEIGASGVGDSISVGETGNGVARGVGSIKVQLFS
jgi:hypothetical protein